MAELTTIKRRRDFLAARNGRTARMPGFLLVRQDRGDALPARIGFTVTKKIGGAVVRNRIRRRLREVARAVFPDMAATGADYIVIAHGASGTRAFALLLDDMKRALLRLAASSPHPK